MFGNVCKEGATQTVGRGITRIFPGVRTIFPVLFHIPIPPSPNSQPRFNASSSLTLSAPTWNVCFRIPDPEARFSKVPVGAILSTKIPTGKSGPPQRIFELRFESRWSPDFFRLLLSNCLNWKIYCDDHSSLSSTTAVQKWIISYILHIISLLTGDMNSINWPRSQCVAS